LDSDSAHINVGELRRLLKDSQRCPGEKPRKYFKKANDTPTYYTAIPLDPILKKEWHREAWADDEDKRAWIPSVMKLVREF